MSPASIAVIKGLGPQLETTSATSAVLYFIARVYPGFSAELDSMLEARGIIVELVTLGDDAPEVLKALCVVGDAE